MRKFLLLLPGLALLCGFGAAPYEMDAVPRAMAARNAALAQCRARTDFKSVAEALDCAAAADHDFAHAVRLRDDKLLGSYDGAMAKLDADIAAGTLQPGEAVSRFQAIQAEFFKSANDQYAVWDSARKNAQAGASSTQHDIPSLSNIDGN